MGDYDSCGMLLPTRRFRLSLVVVRVQVGVVVEAVVVQELRTPATAKQYGKPRTHIFVSN